MIPLIRKITFDLKKIFRVIIITEGKLYMYLKGGISNTIFTRNFNHKQFAKYLVFVFRMGLAELVLTDYIQGYSVGLLFRQQRLIVGKFWHTGLSCSCWRGSLWGYPHLCWHWRLWEFLPLGCRSKERRFFRQCWCRRCKSWQTSCWWCLPGLPDQRSRTTCQGQPVSMVMCHLTWNKICKQIDSKTLLVVQHFIFSFTERFKFYKTWNFKRIFNTCIIN